MSWLAWELLLSRTQRGTPRWQHHMYCHYSYICWGIRLHNDKVHNLKQTWFFQLQQVQNYSRIWVAHVRVDLPSVLLWILKVLMLRLTTSFITRISNASCSIDLLEVPESGVVVVLPPDLGAGTDMILFAVVVGAVVGMRTTSEQDTERHAPVTASHALPLQLHSLRHPAP